MPCGTSGSFGRQCWLSLLGHPVSTAQDGNLQGQQHRGLNTLLESTMQQAKTAFHRMK